jgi:hypothetical protein
MSSKIIRHWCPDACGWYRDSERGRDRHKDKAGKVEPAWGEEIITHPLHGAVSKAQAAALDIARHDCGQHRAALARLRLRLLPKLAA